MSEWFDGLYTTDGYVPNNYFHVPRTGVVLKVWGHDYLVIMKFIRIKAVHVEV